MDVRSTGGRTFSLDVSHSGNAEVRYITDMVAGGRVDSDRPAAAELTTFYYYTILRANLIGLEGEGIKKIADTTRIEDRNHFEALVPRIYELGGMLPDDMKAFHDRLCL